MGAILVAVGFVAVGVLELSLWPERPPLKKNGCLCGAARFNGSTFGGGGTRYQFAGTFPPN